MKRRSTIGIAMGFFLTLLFPVAAQIPMRPPVNRPPAYDPDLVLAYVTVMGSGKAPPPRLDARHFHILEDGVEQKIDYFSVQDQPISVGIVWGAGTAFDDPAPDPQVRECPRTFLRNSTPGIEYFVLAGDTVLQSFTTNVAHVPFTFARSGSGTDHIYIGLDVLKEAANSRKILLVVTDLAGGSGGQLEPSFMEAVSIKQGVQIYVLSLASAQDANLSGLNLFGELSDLTGGSYYLGPPSDAMCEQLAKELKVQYLIGYHSTNREKNGKWRKLDVKLDASADGRNLRARIKRGYYGPKAR